MTSNNIFAWAFENLRTGAVLAEKSTGRIMEANAAFLSMCGRARQDVVGRNFWAPPLIADSEAGAEVFEYLRAGGRLEETEMPLERADGHLLIEVSGAELAGGIVQLEVQDATARAGARVAARMDAQRALASRMAEEFARVADGGEEIARELRAYGGQLLLASKPLQVNELMLGLQREIEPVLGRDIQIALNLSPDISVVLADSGELQQIILKLATNSRDAMSAGGKFHISTRNAAANDPALARSHTGGPYVMIEIRDEGQGLDDASWAHLFEPFFTTKSNGRGLGLAAVYGAVRQMNGHLWAHSEPGKGTTFRIYLPSTDAKPAELPNEPNFSKPAATILLMEQNDGLRTVVASILRKRGYRVLAAAAPADAREIAAQQPQLRTLCLNGHTKPFDLDGLLGKVKELLEV